MTLQSRWPLALATVLTLHVPAAVADPVSDFYSANNVRIIIRSGPGGTYDLYSRLLSQHMPNHLPGRPAMINVHMPGGGGIIAANHVGLAAPRDGTILSIVGLGLPVDQALGLNKSLQVNLRDFNWIGSISSSNQVLVTWHKSKVTSLKSAREIPSQIGSTGAGSVSQQYPAFYNAFLGTKFNVIFGYGGTPQLNLAMERGEIDGSGSASWAQYTIEATRLVKEKMIVPLIQVGLEKEPDLQDVPLLLDLAKTPEETAAFRFLSNSVNFGRPVATTRGVPADRLAALRHAFDQTMVDPRFLDDVKRAGGEVRPMSSGDLSKLVDELTMPSEPLRTKLRAVLAQR